MEKYKTPVAEIVTFAMQDIVTASCEDAQCNSVRADSNPVAYEPLNW